MEGCRQKIGDILTEQLKMEPTIENAHRVGLSITHKRRAIVCKFIYRPERFKVLQKKRDLQNNVWITEDLIWEDREKKKKLNQEMGHCCGLNSTSQVQTKAFCCLMR